MKRFALRLGIDRAVFFTLLGRGWNVGAGLLTIVVIAHFLSAEMQGYYYTFNSLIALQIFAEMGLNFALIQFASHEMAELTWQADGTVTGSPIAKRRLQSLLNFAYAWFGVAALLMIVILMPLGLYFFGVDTLAELKQSPIAIPWLLLVLLTTINLFITASAAILEGCGKVAQVAGMRLWQAIFATSGVCAVLFLGGELYALVANSLLMALIGAAWFLIKQRRFFTDLLVFSADLPGMSWRKEILPFQWRIAVSWMSGYLIFQLFNPLLFKTHGAVAAGQMGMSLQVIAAMNSVAMVWITTKAPTYGQLIATKQFAILNTLFARGLLQSSGFLLLGVILVCSGLFYLNEIASPYAARVLPLPLFLWLFFICLANHIVFAEAAYLRAFKKEPFMALSVLNGLVTAVLAIVLVPPLGVAGAVYSYTATALVISLLAGTFVFFRKRRDWITTLPQLEKQKQFKAEIEVEKCPDLKKLTDQEKDALILDLYKANECLRLQIKQKLA